MADITLESLLQGLESITSRAPVGPAAGLTPAQTLITGVTCDPNLCRLGTLYVAAESETVDSTRYGVRLDGRDFIEKAVANGAAAVLTNPACAPDLPVPLIWHPQPLSILGTISSRFFGEPRPRHIALVTGTNGKTSTVNFCRMMWTAEGHQACSIGNLGGVCSDGTLVWDRDPTLSVPETVTLHQILHRVAGNGVDYVAMECTSHALFDNRVHGVPATIGAFTNLTRDHLDFHHNLEEYFNVKMRLFREVLAPGSWAVLNADAEYFDPAFAICKERGHQIISFGRKGNEIRLLDSQTEADGQKLTLEVYGKKYETKLNLLGFFQTANMMTSLGILIASGITPDRAVRHIGALRPVEGRLETVAYTPAGGRVIVDFAHTPDGIKAALEACRSFTEGELYIVFGCNAESDLGKRPEMGAMAAKLADKVIITDEHPRHEDPLKIRLEVLAAAPGARQIGGRARAIETAMRELGKGSTLLVAGMGHENFQCIGDQKLPYSDYETVRRAAAEMSAAVNAKK